MKSSPTESGTSPDTAPTADLGVSRRSRDLRVFLRPRSSTSAPGPAPGSTLFCGGALKQTTRLTAAAGAAALALCAAPAAAQDVATRGAFVGGGGGMLTGSATDDEGRGAGGFLGGGGHFRFGEEALPGLTLGLEFLGGSGAGNNERYDTGFGGFVLQASWRPFSSVEGLVFLLGTGVGGGSLTGKGGDGFEGLAGGSLHEIGVLYEFALYRDGLSSFVIAPAVRWWVVPTTADNEVWLQSFSVGVDTTWYAGSD